MLCYILLWLRNILKSCLKLPLNNIAFQESNVLQIKTFIEFYANTMGKKMYYLLYFIQLALVQLHILSSCSLLLSEIPEWNPFYYLGLVSQPIKQHTIFLPPRWLIESNYIKPSGHWHWFLVLWSYKAALFIYIFKERKLLFQAARQISSLTKCLLWWQLLIFCFRGY